MFFQFDRDRSGTLERDEVAAAIRSLGRSWAGFDSAHLPLIPLLSGYDLSPRNVTILFNRFAKHRRYMNIDDFAACLSRVKIMNGELCMTGKIQGTQFAFLSLQQDTFKKHSGGGMVTLSKDQVRSILIVS